MNEFKDVPPVVWIAANHIKQGKRVDFFSYNVENECLFWQKVYALLHELDNPSDTEKRDE